MSASLLPWLSHCPLCAFTFCFNFSLAAFKKNTGDVSREMVDDLIWSLSTVAIQVSTSQQEAFC